MYTSAYKLKCDAEQARYLAAHLSDAESAAFFRDVVAPAYEAVLENIPPLDRLSKTGGLYPLRTESPAERALGTLYNRALHVTDAPEPRDGAGRPLPLLNARLDADAVEARWRGDDPSHGTPGVVWVDDLLTPEALDAVRTIMLESTVFYQTKMPERFGGYVGAYLDDGLHDRLLLRLAFELHGALPGIMGDHPLKYLWCYKYDSQYTGINTHADQAAVNVNIWLAPDSANLDPHSGGLVVYTARPPDHWDFEDYNTSTERVVKELLEPTGFANVTVPHRQNRAVIFDSALFHHTDAFRFREGYENRRINLTLLYGDMQKGVRGAAGPAAGEL